MRILRSSYFVKLENLSNIRIRIERINSIELKFDSTITLIKRRFSHQYFLKRESNINSNLTYANIKKIIIKILV